MAVRSLFLFLAGCLSCSVKQNPDQLKDKTAETTAALKRDAKAIAAGVREGWSRDKPLNLNNGTKAQLESLPGIDAARADRIIANRPYSKPEELVNRRVLSRHEYDRISDLVIAKK
jgi:DNA uptake protein ComE-like DNA-binding protein